MSKSAEKMTQLKIEIKTLSAKKVVRPKPFRPQKSGPAMAGPALPPTTALEDHFNSHTSHIQVTYMYVRCKFNTKSHVCEM